MAEQLARHKITLLLLAVLVVSAALGAAWGSSSVSIVDTGPWQLEKSYQGIYVQAVADAYQEDGNDSLAAERLSYLCQADGGLAAALDEAELRYGSDPQKRANLDQLKTLVNSGRVMQNEAVAVCNLKSISSWASLARILAPLLLVLLALAIVGFAVMRVIRASEEQAAKPAAAVPAQPPTGVPAPSASTAPPPTQAPPTRARGVLPPLPFGRRAREQETVPRSAAALGAQISRTVEKTDFEAIGEEPPLVQFMTTYLHGDDLYDDSFSIETPSGEFLGETGVGISETISAAAEAKNVTALEVWLFDKNDIRTVTKVLMSDYAFNDDAIRARLAPKGEAVLAKAGDRLWLETATLRVQARIVDLSYKSGTMPPNSVIERITIELAAWKREPQAGRPGGGLPGAPSRVLPTGLPPFPSGGSPS